MRTFTGPVAGQGANTADWRRADIGALNGHGNARSVARSCGDRRSAVRPAASACCPRKTIDLIFDEQADGVDLVLGVPLRFGIGYALPQAPPCRTCPSGTICFWGGWGGSLIVMDLDRRLTISYMMNKMAPGIIGSDRAESYLRAVYDALG